MENISISITQSQNHYEIEETYYGNDVKILGILNVTTNKCYLRVCEKITTVEVDNLCQEIIAPN